MFTILFGAENEESKNAWANIVKIHRVCVAMEDFYIPEK